MPTHVMSYHINQQLIIKMLKYVHIGNNVCYILVMNGCRGFRGNKIFNVSMNFVNGPSLLAIDVNPFK